MRLNRLLLVVLIFGVGTVAGIQLDRTPTNSLLSSRALAQQPKPRAGFKPTKITDSSGGTASTTFTLLSTSVQRTEIIPCQNLDFINSGAITISLPYNFTLVSAVYRTNKPATTAAKAATLTLSTSGGSLTGGVVALTSANLNTQGGTNAFSAISGANATVAAGGTIIATASSVTTFVEGDGYIELTCVNNDLAAALATIAKQLNSAIDQF